MLVLCTCCTRHVRASEPKCPFCGAEREASSDDAAPARVARTRAAFLAGAAAAVAAGGMQVAACGGAYGGPPPDWQHHDPNATDAGDAGVATTPTFAPAPMYGIAPTK